MSANRDENIYDSFLIFGEGLLKPGGEIKLLNNLKRTLVELKKIYELVQGRKYAEKSYSDLEWFCDNYYLIVLEGKKAAAAFKAVDGFSLCLTEESKTEAAALRLAREILAFEKWKLKERGISDALLGFLSAYELRSREIAMFDSILRLAVVREILSIARMIKDDLSFDASEEGLEKRRIRSCVRGEKLSNLFSSLRFLQSVNFKEIFEKVCPLENTLKEDPAGVYEKMSEKSRAYLRFRVEKRAQEEEKPENELAKDYIERAKEKGCHVGALILEGEREEKKRRKLSYAYFIGLFSFSSILAAVFWGVTGHIACGLFFLLPAFETVKTVWDSIIIKRVDKRPVLSIKYERIPKESRTIALIATLLKDRESLKPLFKKIEEYASVNEDESLCIGILADLPESERKDEEKEAEIIKYAVTEIEKLNCAHPSRSFCIFVRKQIYVEKEGIYFGRERKRGAVLELVRHLKDGGGDFLYAKDLGEKENPFKYLIILDEDTRLPIGSARYMAGVMDYPLNRPVFDEKTKTVKEGFGILQPRMERIPKPGTGFSVYMTGDFGINSYNDSAKELYQDLFLEGSFCGKGMINIDAYYEGFKDDLMERVILSHDTIEGGYLRCAYDSGVYFLEEELTKAAPFFKRLSRWIRGDVQNFLYLFREIKNCKGEKIKNPLSLLSKWRILENVRRGVTPVFWMLATLSLALIFGGRSNIAFLILLFSFLLPGIKEGLALSKIKKEKTFYKNARNKWAALFSAVYRFSLLPTLAWVNGKAALTALYRLFISKRKTLEWQPAGSFKGKGSGFLLHLPCIIMGLLALPLTKINPMFLGIGILWLISIIWTYFLSKEKQEEDLPEDDKKFLQECATRMFSYFENFQNAENNYLPPDNVQFEPQECEARRTSPTNIGLSLLCIISAYDLKLLEKDEMRTRLERTLKTITALKKWNGHLYNWYNTETLEVLPPAYISSVDSGNFLACLLTLRSFLKEEGLLELEKTAGELLENCDLMKLYDEKKDLFTIGAKENGEMDGSYYDLLASEARITSYLAVARGIVPKEHFSKLSRMMSLKDGYRGLYSWSGTMFEYFMPAIFMPDYDGTILSESLNYCLYCQKKRTGKTRPFGISESAFYAFDPSLNYQYKAFGVQALSLKGGQDEELVVSPYSSFLSLCSDKKGSLQNLKRLKERGCYGEYGHFEAIDYRKKEDGVVVCAVMAHHIGMSLLSIVNVLMDNKMQKRFMADPHMGGAQELLYERIQPGTPAKEGEEYYERVKYETSRGNGEEEVLEIERADKSNRRLTILGSPKQSEVFLSGGAGYIASGDILITRKSFDEKDLKGIFAFIIEDGEEKPLGFSMMPFENENLCYSAYLSGFEGKHVAKNDDWELVEMACAFAGEPLSFRFYEIKNKSGVEKEIDFCIYFEPVLMREPDDLSHLTFSKLFLEMEELDGGVLAKRRKRTERGRELFLYSKSFGAFENAELKNLRAEILKDGMKNGFLKEFGGILKNPLEPCLAFKKKIKIAPGEVARGGLVISFNDKKEDAVLKARNALLKSDVEILGLSRARFLAEEELLVTHPKDREGILKIIEEVILDKGNGKRKNEALLKNKLSKRDLWGLSLSGDMPILLFELSEKEENLSDLHEMILAHRLLFLRGIKTDLVILYNGGDYQRVRQDKIKEALKKYYHLDGVLFKDGGVYLLDLSTLSNDGKNLLYAASVYSPGDCRDERADQNNEAPEKALVAIEKPEELIFDNGFGGFDENGYVIYKKPPRPFSYIMSNGQFGAVLTSSGGGFSFSKNAREFKITSWGNDPVLDLKSEEVLLKTDEGCYDLYEGRACYCLGVAVFEGFAGEIKYRMFDFVSPNFPVRVRLLELENTAERKKDLSILFFAEPVLGVHREETKRNISVWFDEGNLSLIAQNRINPDFSETKVFMAQSPVMSGYTSSMTDKNAMRYDTMDLSGHGGVILASDQKITLEKGEKTDVSLLLGSYENSWGLKEALWHLREPAKAGAAMEKTRKQKSEIYHRVKISTPDKKLDLLINEWLPYQSHVCRIQAKTGFYQCGGAYGFRDQLQDSLALLYLKPEITRLQLIRAACHQFLEGDVQHWWHPIREKKGYMHRGIRTRHSDSHLWLCYVMLRYIESTGDRLFLHFGAPYLEGEPLKEKESERYFIPKKTFEAYSLYDHCKRAISASMKFGGHGLCLIGRGDWNDGMNLVGAEGRGESVWLTMFFSGILKDFAPICRYMGDEALAKEYEELSLKLKNAVEESAWDGEWYKRAFFDDGTPLGSKQSGECKIDSLPQSFSVLTGLDFLKERRENALRSAYKHLVDEKNKVVKLFSPPFEKWDKNPGYIKSYPPGVRENGGQYTHAALWLSMALFEEGKKDEGYKILEMINPLTHGGSEEDEKKYEAEPYVMPADVYCAEHHTGKAGWTWYTGAASWYYRAVLERLLGLKLKEGYFVLEPNLPSGWDEARIKFCYLDSVFHIHIKNGGEATYLNGAKIEDGRIFAADGKGEYYVEVK